MYFIIFCFIYLKHAKTICAAVYMYISAYYGKSIVTNIASRVHLGRKTSSLNISLPF